MINISEIVQSSGWKNFMAKLYGLGAAVVIVGALFKIQHWPGAGYMLTVGLSVEAVIFFFSAFEPIHEEVDWTLVYPELAGMTDEEEINKYKSHSSHGHGGHSGSKASVGEGKYAGSDAALAKFDQMIEKAEITPELFQNLGKGLQKLSETSAKLNDLSDASAATSEYVNNMKAASSSLGSLTDVYEKSNSEINESAGNLAHSYKSAAESVLKIGDSFTRKLEETGESLHKEIKSSGEEIALTYKSISGALTSNLENIVKENKNYSEYLDSLNKNMAALNAVYELQLQTNSEQLKKNQSMYSDFSAMMDNLKASVEETKKYKEELSSLQQNLASLNNIYGNMLSAMQMFTAKK